MRPRLTVRLNLVVVAALVSFLQGLPAAELPEALTSLHTGKYAESIRQARQAIEAGERGEDWPLVKIRAELMTGQYEEAKQTLEAALKKNRSSVRLRWVGCRVYRFNGLPEEATRCLNEIDQLVRRLAWRYRDTQNLVTLGQYFLEMKADPKEVLGKIYDQAKKADPKSVDAYLASGELALQKNDYQLAADAFRQAAKLAPERADAHFGLARAFGPSDSEKSGSALKLAMELNPKYVDAMLFLADRYIDAENYDEAEDLLDQVQEVNAKQPAAWAYRAVLAHLANRPEQELEFRNRALKSWSTNPHIDHLIGRKLSQKYRFREAAEYQRASLAFDAKFTPAKLQLSQDLLRLGDEELGWKLADEVYAEDEYNVFAHNLVTLHDSMTKYESLESDHFIVRMEPHEAGLYGHLVLDLLERAKRKLCDKYEYEVQTPVIVEIFARQEDFAIRTFGLPGGAGFLGVCFGQVITANSPATQGEDPSNWQATLWHEFCHVVTLQMTNNRMPRWLSEGISVYEEMRENESWGQAFTPEYRAMVLGDDLTPVSKLSEAFLQPKSPRHLQFAYFESALVVEYLIDQYGFDTLRRVLIDLGVGMPINESLQRYAGSLKALDAEFAQYARERARDWSSEADWTELPEALRAAREGRRLPDDTDTTSSASLDEWMTAHPDSFWGLRQVAARHLQRKQWEEVKAPLQRLIQICPEHVGEDSAYGLLARAHRELGESEQEKAVLTELAARDASSLPTYRRLLELNSLRQDWLAVVRYVDQALAVDPLHAQPYRHLAEACTQMGNHQRAIDAFRALLLLNPIDPSELHFRLAGLYVRAENLTLARRHVLMCLEETPRYRNALRLLTEIRRLREQHRTSLDSPSDSKIEKTDQ